ncbi:hypothetical protein CJ030_MR2G024127 [Morella rubra]|uniref:GRF-type domain-containing protein n=1 Tax=Morella rubra TaxID=262757 RepID=A0A6A1WE56_9ROSI|nr:hypothetical protein CJ030_MR2G024127 [Morella rubra]
MSRQTREIDSSIYSVLSYGSSSVGAKVPHPSTTECKCGLPAQIRTSKKMQSKGRRFYGSPHFGKQDKTAYNLFKWYDQSDSALEDIHIHDLIEENKKMDNRLKTMEDLLARMEDLLKRMEEKMRVMEAQLQLSEELHVKEIERSKMLRIMLICLCGFYLYLGFLGLV